MPKNQMEIDNGGNIRLKKVLKKITISFKYPVLINDELERSITVEKYITIDKREPMIRLGMPYQNILIPWGNVAGIQEGAEELGEAEPNEVQ